MNLSGKITFKILKQKTLCWINSWKITWNIIKHFFWMIELTHHSIIPGLTYIDGATNKNNPYDLYKVLTFKWRMSKFEPNRIISLQITVI